MGVLLVEGASMEALENYAQTNEKFREKHGGIVGAGYAPLPFMASDENTFAIIVNTKTNTRSLRLLAPTEEVFDSAGRGKLRAMTADGKKGDILDDSEFVDGIAKVVAS